MGIGVVGSSCETGQQALNNSCNQAGASVLEATAPLRFLYISFDTVPAPKGAAIHIEAFTQAIATALGSLQLITVAPGTEILTVTQTHPHIHHLAFPAIGPSLIHRILHFRAHLIPWLRHQVRDYGLFDIIHVRSIYEGFPIAAYKSRYCRQFLFEVNGLPSIELKYRYPDVVEDRLLLFKFIAQEQVCLKAADRVITPSKITADYLQTREVPALRIQVIPNGVEMNCFTYQSPLLARCVAFSPTQPLRLLYFGTLSAWQGVELAIRAIALWTEQSQFTLAPSVPIHLTILASASKRQQSSVQKLIDKLQIQPQVELLDPVPQEELVRYLHRSHALVAPLTWNDRNLIQGCCPLKVLEGMATGTPVITSDLPVVRELGDPNVHFLTVKAGSAQAIATAIQHLVDHPTVALDLAQAARQRIESTYTWQRAGAELVQCYRTLARLTASNT